MEISLILELPESAERTAALAEWLQSLYTEDPPILVGGSAVELYTAKLESLARKEGVELALRALLQAAKRWRGAEPRREELEEWARRPPVE